jgi:hypothetical protein
VTNYPQITLSSGLVGVVVDTSIDDALKGKCMCKAMQHLRASAVAAMLRDPADTSRCLLDYEAASRLTDEDYEAFWKALGYTLAYDDHRVKIEGEMYSPHTDDGGHTVLLLSSSCKSVWDHSSGKEIAPEVLARNGALAYAYGVQLGVQL